MSQPFPVTAFQLDVARRLERPETLLDAVRGMHRYGYNACVLYLEDAYDYPRHPGIGRPNAYTVEQMKRVQALCATQGMTLIPVIPALGHASYITAKQGYADYDEGRGTGGLTGTLSPSFPETYELLGELFADWCDHLPGEYLHVGLDESPAMGAWAVRQGQHVDHAAMFADHCNRLNAMVKALGRRMIMWGDMFYYYPEAIGRIDTDIVVADWYYYAFADTPRVEALNFAPVDLTRRLVDAGFEVWGVPSVWPNLPIGDIADRWQNTADWARYGGERGMRGILVSDWENSCGFCANTVLLLRTFGRLLGEGGTLSDRLGECLVEMIGDPAAAALVPDLLELGRHHLTGRDDRVLFSDPPAAVAIAGRRARCEGQWRAVSNLLGGLDAISAVGPEPAGRQLLTSLCLTRDMIRLAWRYGARLPRLNERLTKRVADGGNNERLSGDFRGLADEIAAFAVAYAAHWAEVRFADDPAPASVWAERAATALRGWADELRRPLGDHSLYRQSRLECHLRCRHPALPVARITVRWADGHEQRFGLAMIRFASPYARPNKRWDEHRAFLLDRADLPVEITVAATNYGQVGLEELAVVVAGARHVYRCEVATGANLTLAEGIPWLGPVGACPGDPTTRPDADSATFRPADGG